MIKVPMVIREYDISKKWKMFLYLEIHSDNKKLVLSDFARIRIKMVGWMIKAIETLLRNSFRQNRNGRMNDKGDWKPNWMG
jgi:hypothetical protein